MNTYYMIYTYVFAAIFLIVIASLCYYVESFDIKTDNSLPVISGDITNTITDKKDLNVTGNLNVTGDLSVGGKIIIGTGDNQWTINSDMQNNWLNFYSNQTGNNKGPHVNKHGRIIMAPDGNIWSQAAGWSTEINGTANSANGTANSANSKVDSILNGGATIAGDLNVNGKLNARGGHIELGSGDNAWNIRAQGVGGTPERWLEFWNNQEGAPRNHGRVLFNKFGNMWNQLEDRWYSSMFDIVRGRKAIALKQTGGKHMDYANTNRPWVHTEGGGYMRLWSEPGYYTLNE